MGKNNRHIPWWKKEKDTIEVKRFRIFVLIASKLFGSSVLVNAYMHHDILSKSMFRKYQASTLIFHMAYHTAPGLNKLKWDIFYCSSYRYISSMTSDAKELIAPVRNDLDLFLMNNLKWEKLLSLSKKSLMRLITDINKKLDACYNLYLNNTSTNINQYSHDKRYN